MASAHTLAVTTPLGPDVFHLAGFRGQEGLSQLFSFHLELQAENRQNIAFEKLIGQKVSFSILLPDGKTKRFFSGICNNLTQDGRDATFTNYRMEIVPQLWLLTRRTQCRIFQYQTIPDILKTVLAGIDFKLELQGTFEPRDFCVQYRESDFDFASRLMEEEGIYYYFKHADGSHQMILSNTPQSHADAPFAAKAIYEELEGGNRPDMRIHRWEKSQQLRSGKVTLWDHCFELPHQHLDAERPTQESVEIGKVSHKLKLPANDALELYDYPGEYAQRFDGVDRGGGDQAGNLQKIFQDNKRVASIRMEQEALPGIVIHGTSNCRQFMAGHKFTLERHYNADGQYVLSTVDHSARSSLNLRSGGAAEIVYENRFTCIPISLPFRPLQQTEKPTIPGPQTAVVVGPPGEKIFCDKYGRVKVQFHWDRQGKKTADSSCWVRVSQNWGGANWGGMFLPHVGHEVIVSFEEGDPDRPLITGRVYNAECMPPLELPGNKTKSIIRDHGGNEIVMEGEAGKQQLRLFSPKHNTHFHLGNSFNVFTESKWLATINDNVSWKTLANWQTNIVGDLKIDVGGNVTDLYVGWNHKTTLGWTSGFIGGFKSEMVVGYDTKIIRGVKTEITKGTTIKCHQGNTYETTPADAKKVKQGMLEQISGMRKQFVGKAEMESKAQIVMKAATKMEVDAKDWKVLAESMCDMQMKDGMLKASAKCTIDAATLKQVADKIIADAEVNFNKGALKIK